MGTEIYESQSETFDDTTDSGNSIKEDVILTSTIKALSTNQVQLNDGGIPLDEEGLYFKVTDCGGYQEDKYFHVSYVSTVDATGDLIGVCIRTPANLFSVGDTVKVVRRQFEYLDHTKGYWGNSLKEIRPYNTIFWDNGEGGGDWNVGD